MSANRPAVIFCTLCGLLLAEAGKGQDGGQGGDGGGPGERYYNVKAGPVYITLGAGMTVQYTDNLNLASGLTGPLESDISYNPHLNLDAVTEVDINPGSNTSRSTLGLHMTIGYLRYMQHPELNRNMFDITVAPDSELSLLVHVGQVKLRFFDRLSLQSDPVSDGSLSNVAMFRRLTNSAGASAQWDINSRASTSLAYVHSNVWTLDLISLGGQPTNLTARSLDNSTDTLTFSAYIKPLERLTTGVQASVSSVTFPGAPSQDSTTYTYGPFAELVATDYTTIRLSGGMAETRRGSVFAGTGGEYSTPADSTSEYADLTITNKLNTYYSQSLSLGRQVAISLIGDPTQTDYVRYSSVWRVNSEISLHMGLYAEHCTQLGSNNPAFDYQRYGGELSTSYQLARRLTTSLAYRHTEKVAKDPYQSYKQNTVTWDVSYQF